VPAAEDSAPILPTNSAVPSVIGYTGTGGFPVIQERSTALASLRSARAIDPMRQFRHGDCAERDFRLTYFRKDHFQELGDVEMPALAFDHNAGVENYSQNGGFHGSLRREIPSSTSFMKPSSNVTVEPRDSASAMHSESVRPLGSGECTMATGRWSCSTIQHAMNVRGQFRFGNTYLRHRFDHSASCRTIAEPLPES